MKTRNPCAVCGRQPEYAIGSRRWICHHAICGKDTYDGRVLTGPYGDEDGSKWDTQMRAIKVRVLADVRAQIERRRDGGREMKAYNTADVDGLLGVAFAALRYLEAREATAEAKMRSRAFNRPYSPEWHCTDQKVRSAAARQSAAMRWLKRAAKQLENNK